MRTAQEILRFLRGCSTRFSEHWTGAEFRSTKGGVKINMKYDINNSVPDYLFITNAKEHENNTLDKMRLKRGYTVAIDKGYCNYERFGSCCDQGILFVTRLKDNARYEVVESRRTGR